jgi:hypothetical protein
MIDWRKLWRRLGVALSFRDPPNVPSYGWSYFDHLVALYVTLNTADKRADAVIQKATERPDDLTWGDIFLLENIIFSLQPPEVVERSAWIIRERLREIAGPSIYDRYVASHLPDEADTAVRQNLLRADLTRVLDVLHWYYSLIPVREKIRRSLTERCLRMVVIYTGLLGIIEFFCHAYNMNFIAMTACVIYWGIIGGFVSSQRRMQKIPPDGDPLISVFGLENADYYLWLSPLLGAVFAVILGLMFIAGILKGSLFPEFFVSPPGNAGLPLFHFSWETLPRTGEEYAKLFVWAFLAGFAERLVPDNLDRLSARLGPDKEKSPSSSVPPSRVAGGEPPPAPLKLDDQKPKEEIRPEVLQETMQTGETMHAQANESKRH